jgi:hypothetical protein
LVPISLQDLAVREIRETGYYGHSMTGPHPFPAVLEGSSGRGVNLRWKIIGQKQDVHLCPVKSGKKFRGGEFYFNALIGNTFSEFRMVC